MPRFDIRMADRTAKVCRCSPTFEPKAILFCSENLKKLRENCSTGTKVLGSHPPPAIPGFPLEIRAILNLLRRLKGISADYRMRCVTLWCVHRRCVTPDAHSSNSVNGLVRESKKRWNGSK